jgi:hypothetical protein
MIAAKTFHMHPIHLPVGSWPLVVGWSLACRQPETINQGKPATDPQAARYA